MQEDMQALNAYCGPKTLGVEQRPSVSLRLVRQRDRLVAELAEVNDAIAALEAQPGVQQVLDKLSSLGMC